MHVRTYVCMYVYIYIYIYIYIHTSVPTPTLTSPGFVEQFTINIMMCCFVY